MLINEIKPAARPHLLRLWGSRLAVLLQSAWRVRWQLMLALLMLALLFLAGVSVPLMGLMAVAFWGGLGLVLIGVVVHRYHQRPLLNLGFLAVFATFFLFPLLFKLVGINLVNRWQFLAFLLAPLGMAALAKEALRDAWLRASLYAFAGFLLALTVSTLFAQRSMPIAAAYQLFSDLKPLLMICLGFALARLPGADRWVWRMGVWILLPLLALMVFQWVAHGAYASVFRFPAPPVLERFGLFPSRGYGLFEHPSIAAGFAAAMSLFFIGSALFDLPRRRKALLLATVYAIVLLGAGGRGELAAMLGAAIVLLLLCRANQILLRTMVVLPLAALVMLLFWMVYSESITSEALKWGGSAVGGVEHPRAQLYQGAFLLAQKYWPLGSGLGTYGGAGASNFDQSLYYQLGFAQQWWFKDENYLLDIYWHNSLGEGGWIGMSLLLLQYLLLLVYALRRLHKAQGREAALWSCAFAGTLMILINSLASPGFQDPRLFFVPAVCFGLAASMKEKHHA